MNHIKKFLIQNIRSPVRNKCLEMNNFFPAIFFFLLVFVVQIILNYILVEKNAMGVYFSP